MNKVILGAATALSMISVPALADHHTGDHMEMTAAQQMMYDDLNAADQAEFDTYEMERKTTYFGWNDDLRTYYWTLNDDQQEAWWYLNDNQRSQVYQIPAEQRSAAWNSILTQVAQMEGTMPASQQASNSSAMNANSNANMRFVSNAVVQNIPAPHQGEYPVCESDADDNCINAWATGRRGPGVDRPLEYWPGDRS